MNYMLRVKHLPLTDGRILVGEQPIPVEFEKEKTAKGYRINGVNCKVIRQTSADTILEVDDEAILESCCNSMGTLD